MCVTLWNPATGFLQNPQALPPYRMHLCMEGKQVLAELVLECMYKAERDVNSSRPLRFPDAMDQSSPGTYRPPSSDNSTTLQTKTYVAIVGMNNNMFVDNALVAMQRSK
ncbi:hypothetical protein J6590_033074 [Homalodisca vitripennis]|nr:hypothetical protein J6590_033074 [Homalodisca vitripennis]